MRAARERCHAGRREGKQKNKSEGKWQKAKGKSKIPGTTFPDRCSPYGGFAIGLLHFVFCLLPFAICILRFAFCLLRFAF
jgi:hypothetical protein